MITRNILIAYNVWLDNTNDVRTFLVPCICSCSGKACSYEIKMDGTKVVLIAKLPEHEKNTSKI